MQRGTVRNDRVNAQFPSQVGKITQKGERETWQL